MRRGELHWIDLEPSRGSEASKIRPAVIVSGDAANRAAERSNRGVITVVPLTSNTARVLSFQVLLRAADSGLTDDSKLQAEQVRTVAVDRFRGRIGELPSDVVHRLDDALRTHLTL